MAAFLAARPAGAAPDDVHLVFSGPVSPDALGGHIGVDALDGGDNKLCLSPDTTGCPGGYSTVASWDAAGNMTSIALPGSTATAHLEIYPHSRYSDFTSYDPWRSDMPGGAHIWVRGIRPSQTVDVGGIPLPWSSNGAFRAVGAVVASGGVTDGRLVVDAWQLTGLVNTSAGQQVGTYVESHTRGGQWTLGWAWAGQYIAYITDTVTGTVIQAFLDAGPGRVPTLDLDAVCFGLDACRYTTGSAPAATGAFHPLSPSRIMDTRDGTGRAAPGPVRAGDGRSSSSSTAVRSAEMANHELQVTGKGGVPSTGVSAVVLNVTAVNPTDPGYLTVFPKPPRGLSNPADPDGVWNDQSSFVAGYPNTSNLNFAANDIVPNLVLARVGAGGKIRMDNYAGTVDVVADVVGWFDTGGASGDGYVGMAPRRLLDTRNGTGGIGGRFSSGDARSLQVAGVGGVPADATAAVLNVTAVDPTSLGFVTAWPSGGPRPLASTLNTAPGRTRPNLAVVKLGAGGAISLFDYQDAGGVDLVVDVVGYVRTGGAPVTAIEPQRLLDSRIGLDTATAPWGNGETRTVQVAGRAGVPANATGVFVNVTATLPSGPGFATVWPAGQGQPLASNVNFVPGDNVPNLVFVGLGAGGAVSLYNYGGQTDYVADVVGYVSS